MNKTLDEYIQMYEKHTKEKFEFNPNFSFFYRPDHGFCEYKAEDTGLYIWQLCGDLKYWIGIGYRTCQRMKLPALSAYVLRKPKPFIRALGFHIESEEDRDGCKRYHCRNKAGESLTATQHGDRYIFVWEIRGDNSD